MGALRGGDKAIDGTGRLVGVVALAGGVPGGQRPPRPGDELDGLDGRRRPRHAVENADDGDAVRTMTSSRRRTSPGSGSAALFEVGRREFFCEKQFCFDKKGESG